MTQQSRDRLRAVGRQLLATRKRLGMNRVEFARAAAVSDKSLARLESGEDVRLSTYLAVVEYLKKSKPAVVNLEARVVGLPERGQSLVLEFVAQLERSQVR